MAEDLSKRVRIRTQTDLSDKHFKLTEYDIDYRRGDGSWQQQSREVFDRRDAAAILPIDPGRRTVILVSQFRLPAFLTGYKAPLIEVIAGTLDGDLPDVCVRREAMEEAGIEVSDLRQVYHCFTTPGSVMERMHLFIGSYSDRAGTGGGMKEEGEDIEVLELPFDDAFEMTRNGKIVDIKTIMLLQHVKLSGLA